MNAIQFNALAIVFLLGILPFAVAFITNIGSSSDGEYEDSISSTFSNVSPYAGKWINNGGLNHTAHYFAIDSTPDYANRTYVVDDKCPTVNKTYPPYYQLGDCLTTQDQITSNGILPMNSKYFQQTHWTASLIGAPYVGSSGDGPFTMLLTSAYFSNLVGNETIDKIKFDLVYTPVSYNCGSTIFENLTFDADITFQSPTSSKSFTGFEFSQNTKYEFQQYDPVHGYTTVCNVGLILEFDFTGFETLTITETVGGDWLNTTIQLNIDNLKRADDNIPFTTEALPWAGVNSFSIGVQHQSVDPVQAGFLIKVGTLFLAFGTFALAIASTPYWDPFRNFFKGALD